jgi:hypothetical protein
MVPTWVTDIVKSGTDLSRQKVWGSEPVGKADGASWGLRIHGTGGEDTMQDCAYQRTKGGRTKYFQKVVLGRRRQAHEVVPSVDSWRVYFEGSCCCQEPPNDESYAKTGTQEADATYLSDLAVRASRIVQ